MRNPNQPMAAAAAPWALSRSRRDRRVRRGRPLETVESLSERALERARRDIAEQAAGPAKAPADGGRPRKRPPTLRERIAPSLSPECFRKCRRRAIRARSPWTRSAAVYRAAMARLFFLARQEVAEAIRTTGRSPFRLATVGEG